MSKKIVITGGAGFVGHHFVEHFLKNTDWDIYIFDKLTYAASGFDRVKDIKAFDDKRVTLFACDLANDISDGIIKETLDIDYIFHIAAESHVDNSIIDPKTFIMSNVVGTLHMLEYARKCKNLKTFLYFSTDEVHGPAPIGIDYKEWDRYNCTNPYSASKASSEQLCLSYATCYKLPLMITRSMNIFGERQHPEKFIPMTIKNILKGNEVIIHSSSDKMVSGSRFYIHARNVANACHFLLNRYDQREIYNIVGEKELTNLKLAEIISDILDMPLHYRMVDFHSSRPGHDLRYALDGSKLVNMGWVKPLKIEETLEKTIKWFLENPRWLNL